jgi:hypothetical protein
MSRLEQLLEQWETGSLSAADMVELKQLLASPEARAELVGDWLLGEAIYSAMQARMGATAQAAGASPPSAASAHLRHPKPRASESSARPPSQSPGRGPRRHRWLVWHEFHLSLSWTLGFAAAACLVFAGLYAYYQRAAAGEIAEAREGVAIVRAGRDLAAQAGQALYPGDHIRVPADSAATIAWANEPTRLALAGPAELVLLNPMGGKQLSLPTGVLEASVASQPFWRPLTILTPLAAVKVVGTHFSLSASSTFTRLEVMQGAVRLRKTHPTTIDVLKEVVVRGGEAATATREARLQVQPLTGLLSSEVWSVPPGTALADAPARGTPLASSTEPGGLANPVERLSGFLIAPASGQFTFWIASLNNARAAELWLSTDERPANKRRIAYVKPGPRAPQSPRPAGQGAAARRLADWEAAPNQKSDAQELVQGRRYYLELWHEGIGLDSILLGWRLPDQPGNASPTEVDIQAFTPKIDTGTEGK